MKYQHQRQYLFVILFAWMSLFVSACGTMGYTDVDTTRKAILVANAEIRAGNLLLQDLIGRRAIDRDDAAKALQALQDAKNYLQTALDAVNLAGDPVLAGSNLERAKVALNIAVTLLAPLVEN